MLGLLGRASLAAFWAAELAEAAAWAGSEELAAPAATRGGILSLGLQAPRLEAQKKFYGETLGFPVSLSSGFLTVKSGGTELLFEEAAAGPAAQGPTPIYHIAWAIPENQLAAAKVWLSGRTPLLRHQDGREEFHFRGPNRHAVYFADPEGNILELIARHNLNDGRPGAFTLASILYVNHFGLVVDDMDAAVKGLSTGLGLAPQGIPTPNFTKLGDEHRHLVLVTRKRPWLPEGTVPAEVFSSHVTLHGTPAKTMTLKPHPYVVSVAGADRDMQFGSFRQQ